MLVGDVRQPRRVPARPAVPVDQPRPDALGEVMVVQESHAHPHVLRQHLVQRHRRRPPNRGEGDLERRRRHCRQVLAGLLGGRGWMLEQSTKDRADVVPGVALVDPVPLVLAWSRAAGAPRSRPTRQCRYCRPTRSTPLPAAARSAPGSRSAGRKRSANPAEIASAAPNRAPVNAACVPNSPGALDSRYSPPTSGASPIAVSGIPTCDVSVTIRMLQWPDSAQTAAERDAIHVRDDRLAEVRQLRVHPVLVGPERRRRNGVPANPVIQQSNVAAGAQAALARTVDQDLGNLRRRPPIGPARPGPR